MITLRTPFLAAALFTSVAAVGLTPALGQTTPVPANSGTAQTDVRHHATPRMLPGQLVDGRIAFLKAELKITPAQEAQWQPVAAAMRENANSLDQAITTARQDRGSMDAIQHIALRGQFAKVRADNDARLLAAFKPLYASLSPEQQQLANQFVALHGGRHHHRA
jgi:periplasmic protein CpxP/Spy